MKMKINRLLSSMVMLIVFSALAGCSEPKNQESASGAKQVEPCIVPVNSQGRTCEQQNIYDRIKVTNDPTKIMWIHLVSLDGKIVSRMVVRGKTTSSSKRLEPKRVVPAQVSHQFPVYNGWYVDELLGPDGTYGDSDAYQFWFDPMGRYHQWGTAGGLGYLMTDYPINLHDPIDEMTSLYKADAAAAKWQAEQEAKLSSGKGK